MRSLTFTRLFVQIPCLHDAGCLASVIRDIPRQIEHVNEVKVLVIDDGHSDSTIETAYGAGADYVVSLPYAQSLAQIFAFGMNRCLELGATIIVHTDEDGRYDGKDIPELIRPILQGEADIVIGHRQTDELAHFSFMRKKLRQLGSRTLSLLSDTHTPDATSNFRAYSREAALRLNVFSKFTYTLETLIQAGKNDMVVTHVPVQNKDSTQDSRFSSRVPVYLKRSILTMLRIYALYEPLRTFFYVGGVIFALGLIGVLRFVFFWFMAIGQGHVQSLIISAVLLIIGFQVWMLGIIADLISVNRRLNEDILYRMKKQNLSAKHDRDVVSDKAS